MLADIERLPLQNLWIRPYKKIPCYLVICPTQFAGALLMKNLKYFKVVSNIYEFSHVNEFVES